MPWKKIDTTLEKEEYGTIREQIGTYLSDLKNINVADISIQSENTEISFDTSGGFPWAKPRQLEAIMKTRLEGKRLEGFYESLPNFLRITNKCNLDITCSELDSNEKNPLSFYIRIFPGQSIDKQAVSDYYGKTFVADANIPGGYSGKVFDGSAGYLLAPINDLESRKKYLEMAIQVEKLGFIRERSDPDPKNGVCLGHVCVNPWQMVEEEFVDFTKSMMNRKETQKLTLTSNDFTEEKDRKIRVYEFSATLLPKSNNVEVATIGWHYPLDVSNTFVKSLDLFGVQLSDKDKVSYLKFYEPEHKGREALSRAGSKIGRGIATPFVLAGGGVSSAIDAVKDRWNDYKNNKQRSMKEIQEEIRSHGIMPNLGRKGSCIVFGDVACLRRNIEKKKAEKAQPSQ